MTAKAKKKTAKRKPAAKKKAAVKSLNSRLATIAADTIEQLETRGRKSEFKPEFVERARKLCANGATDYMLAMEFGVSSRTIQRWYVVHDDFRQAVVASKDGFDDLIERSFANRALGYSFEAEKIFHHEGMITRADYVEHVAPCPGAALNWLKNRRPKVWREKVDHEHDVKGGFEAILRFISGEKPAQSQQERT